MVVTRKGLDPFSMAAPAHDPLLELAEQQHGLLARFQLRSISTSRQALHDRLHSSSNWEQLTDHVFRRTGAPRTRAQSTLAAVLDSGEGAALSHESAARWWGSAGCSLRPFHVVRTSRSTRGSTLAVVHTVRRLPPEWVTSLEGVPIVRPELLALQLFAVCSEGRAERLVENLWSMRLLSGASLQRFLDDLGRRGRNGTAGLRRYLEPRGPNYTPAASGVESRAIQLLRESGIEMRRQVDSGGDQWTGRVDLRHPTLPLVVEVQSERYHSALVDREADLRRIQALEQDGFVVVELTDDQVWTRPQEVLAAVRRGIAAAQKQAA